MSGSGKYTAVSATVLNVWFRPFTSATTSLAEELGNDGYSGVLPLPSHFCSRSRVPTLMVRIAIALFSRSCSPGRTHVSTALRCHLVEGAIRFHRRIPFEREVTKNQHEQFLIKISIAVLA